MVDDHPDVRHLLALDLEMEGHEVVLAATFHDAVALLGEVDLLIADRYLADGCGEVLARLARSGGVSSIVISGSYDRRERVDDLTVHQPKPFRLSTLAQVIEEVTSPTAVAG